MIVVHHEHLADLDVSIELHNLPTDVLAPRGELTAVVEVEGVGTPCLEVELAILRRGLYKAHNAAWELVRAP